MIAAENPILSKIFHAQKNKFESVRIEPIKKRKERLAKLENWILRNRKEIKEVIYSDFRKPETEIDTTELYPVLAELRFTRKNIGKWTASKKVDAPLTYLGTRSVIQFEPKGVCLIISPWNFPFNLALCPLISCIAAGNTAIIKPSELTPNTSALIKKMMRELFEEDLVMVIEGGADVTTQLLALPFNHIFFTGSPPVGKIVMRAAAEHLSTVTLELGGKSPAIIEASANLKDSAKRIAFGKFFNNGQTCIAPDYILVDDTIADLFLKELKEAIHELFDISESKINYGRIVNKNHFNRLKDLIDNALDNGAKLEFGGNTNPDENFIEPTILTSVSSNSRIMLEEIFGPVLPVTIFRTVDEVLKIVNSKPKPLALYVFGNDHHFRSSILQKTSAGGVCINDCVIQFTHPNLPFGGINNSGIGKSHGHYGFMAFSNEKPVLKQKSGFTISYLLYPPYKGVMKKIVDVMVRWL